MLAVGIPTYNEADNIASLVVKIELAAAELGVPIVIINSDNTSPDGTAAVFAAINSASEKISLITGRQGKGANIEAILHTVSDRPDIEGCLFIDGDVTSFETSWLAAYSQALASGADYVIPRYGRNYQEGNTTNHFVYPALAMRLGGKAPRQPISGDFGLSKRFVTHLTSAVWSESAHGYGIDIFMTLQAIYGPFVVQEISLLSKLHKPSFDKMVGMFSEVATSYYETMRCLQTTSKPPSATATLHLLPQPDILLEAKPLLASAIKERIAQARAIYSTTPTLIPGMVPNAASFVDAQQWAKVLVRHDSLIGQADSSAIAASLLPWYLFRSTSYLTSITSPLAAIEEIKMQLHCVINEYNYATITRPTR